MRIFKSKWFDRFARKNDLNDIALKAAVAEINAGNFDADLGGHVYKQRVARQGQGKSGGYRTIVLFKQDSLAFFISGFAKNMQENIGDNVLSLYKSIAKKYFVLTDEQISDSIDKGELIEISEAENER